MRILGIETSCDETSAAVVKDGREILSNIIASQIELHRPYGGVVPELASRKHLELIDAIVSRAVQEAGVSLGEMEAIAATYGPGLASSLLIGLNAAKGIALMLGKPFVPINHLEAHLYSPILTRSGAPASAPSVTNPGQTHGSAPTESGQTHGSGPTDRGTVGAHLCGRPFPEDGQVDSIFPMVSLIVSGGHTILAHATDIGRHEVLGQTVDDAAGEAFDKVAKMLGLGYPGGPEIDRLAKQGNPAAIAFPRSMLNEPGYQFSFSGLKTSVRYYLNKHGLPTTPRALADIAASFQEAVVDVLVGKLIRAAEDLDAETVSASGGVSVNSRFRQRLEAECQKRRVRLRLAPAALCTDNAAMIAALAFYKVNSGLAREMACDVEPSAGLAAH